MKPANFTLEKIYYPTLSIRANPEYVWDVPETEPAEPLVRIYMTPTDEPNHYNMSLNVTVNINSNTDRYEIDALAVGHFSTSGGNDLESAKPIALSGPNMLYGAIRDQIMTFTNRSAWGEYILPAVIFEPADFHFPEEEAEVDESE